MGSQILSENWTDESGIYHVVIFIYDESGAPIGMSYSNSTYNYGNKDNYLFVKNMQGDVIAVYNTNGTKLISYAYDAWGNIITNYYNGGASTSARYNPFKYRGYYYDSETGFYYLNSRYYDPKTCRFISADGYLGINGDINSYNLYAYCSNNPIMYIDPSGESIISVLLFGVLMVGLPLILTGSSSNSVVYDEKEYIDPTKPPNPESGYLPPKNNPNPGKVKNPNGPGRGWPDNEGGVWIPDNNQDGGPGWVQQFPGGGHRHRYPSGHIRQHNSSIDNIDYGRYIVGGSMITVSGILIIYLCVNDASGLGALDNFILPPIINIFEKGVQVFNGA